MKIKKLSQSVINRIAAGEVVERPASVIKELLENAIDAKALSLDIQIQNGGINYISILDNGHGMSKEDLEIAILPHTTSKLNEDEITDIKFFGFRGEAIPSIASVSRMTIISNNGNKHAWQIDVDAGEMKDISPASLSLGTKIVVRDLFYITPARLKFLKNERIEASHVIDIVKKIAIAHPEISFNLKDDNRNVLSVTSEQIKERIEAVIGKDFIENSIEINQHNNDISLSGFVSLPTFNRSNSNGLHLFINKRPVKDKLIHTAIRIAYQDVLASDRYPVAVLFLDLPSEFVDVNVHPSKIEVRFRDEKEIRNFLISSLKQAIASSMFKSSSTNTANLLTSFKQKDSLYKSPLNTKFTNYSFQQAPKLTISSLADSAEFYRISQSNFEQEEKKDDEIVVSHKLASFPLGNAKAQLHEMFIISETENGIIMVDQHAAHERIVYEELKSSYHGKNVKTQRILIPEIIEIDAKVIDYFISFRDEFFNLGLVYDKFKHNSIKISEIPAIIENCDVEKLIKDIENDFFEYGENITFNTIYSKVLATFACHHSIRKGRILHIHEMNSLLRKMEQTQNSAQCNHGRPTYIELGVKEIEKLFERT